MGATARSLDTWMACLPWPAPELSPNARNHWATTAKGRKAYRRACWLAALERGGRPAGNAPWEVEYQFQPPPRARRSDEDNLVARMKSGLDGVCDALEINDQDLRIAGVSYGAPDPFGCVWIRIRPSAGKDRP